MYKFFFKNAYTINESKSITESFICTLKIFIKCKMKNVHYQSHTGGKKKFTFFCSFEKNFYFHFFFFDENETFYSPVKTGSVCNEVKHFHLYSVNNKRETIVMKNYINSFVRFPYYYVKLNYVVNFDYEKCFFVKQHFSCRKSRKVKSSVKKKLELFLTLKLLLNEKFVFCFLIL